VSIQRREVVEAIAAANLAAAQAGPEAEELVAGLRPPVRKPGKD
jgi:carbon storage regulator